MLACVIFALSLYFTSAHKLTQFLQFPDALLKPMGVPCPHTSGCPAKAHRHTQPLHSPYALLKLVGTHRPHRGLSLIVWLWWACVPESYGAVPIREAVLGRLRPPGHCTHSRLKHNSRFRMKKAFCLPWSFSLRGRLQVCHTPRGYGGALMERRPVDTILCSP